MHGRCGKIVECWREERRAEFCTKDKKVCVKNDESGQKGGERGMIFKVGNMS